MRSTAIFLAAMCMAGCLSKEEKLALFDDDGDGFHTKFGEDWGGEPPWDCDDERSDVYPGGTEVCDGADNDCNGDADDGSIRVTLYADVDGDGYGVDSLTDEGCEAPDGWSVETGDCDDAKVAVNPGADDVCNGVDDDCDGSADDGLTPMNVYADGDGDGYGAAVAPTVACGAFEGWSLTDDDCDDADKATNPGVVEVWYDDHDANCDGADDFDADGDGHKSDDYAGDDCRDDDEAISPSARESLWDIHIDNDCDGTTADQVVVDVGIDAVRIDGPAATARLGLALITVPAGWLGTEEGLVVSAPGTTNYRGTVYAFERADLVTATSIADATFSLEGPDAGSAPFGPSLGMSLAWAGDAAGPVIVATAPGYSTGMGRVYGWDGASMQSGVAGALFTIDSDRPGISLGGATLSGTDIDGDGTSDLVTSSILDNRVASNSGSVAVFLDPATLSGAVSYPDADTLFTVNASGARLAPVSPGDVDGDGKDDLGLLRSLPPEQLGEPGAYLIVGVPSGAVDGAASADAALIGGIGPMRVVDLDADGNDELLALSGSALELNLPISGTINAAAMSAGHVGFVDDSASWLGWQTLSPVGWRGAPHLFGSWVDDSNRGAIAATTVRWAQTALLDDAPIIAAGEDAGDLFGNSAAFLDFDADTNADMVIGAPGVDRAGADAGAFYVLPGPR